MTVKVTRVKPQGSRTEVTFHIIDEKHPEGRSMTSVIDCFAEIDARYVERQLRTRGWLPGVPAQHAIAVGRTFEIQEVAE